MWYDFVNGIDFTQSETAIQREEFFSYLGRCVSERNFKGVKTMRSKGKKIGYRCLREKQVRTSFDTVLKGNEVEGGEGSRLDAKRNGEDIASEKDKQESSFLLLGVSQKKQTVPFAEKASKKAEKITRL